MSLIPGKPQRLGRHFLTDHLIARRKFSAQALKRIEEAISRGERMHEGQLRFVVEASLPLAQVFRGLEPRARALQLFGQLGVWDTEHNNGVLVYVLLADKDVEIVADRGINRRVPQDTWETVCRAMDHGHRRIAGTALPPQRTRAERASGSADRVVAGLQAVRFGLGALRGGEMQNVTGGEIVAVPPHDQQHHAGDEQSEKHDRPVGR